MNGFPVECESLAMIHTYSIHAITIFMSKRRNICSIVNASTTELDYLDYSSCLQHANSFSSREFASVVQFCLCQHCFVTTRG